MEGFILAAQTTVKCLGSLHIPLDSLKYFPSLKLKLEHHEAACSCHA